MTALKDSMRSTEYATVSDRYGYFLLDQLRSQVAANRTSVGTHA